MKNQLLMSLVLGASVVVATTGYAGPRRPANPRGAADPRGARDPRGAADPRGYNQSRNDALEDASGVAGADRAENARSEGKKRAEGAADALEDASGPAGARADYRENRRNSN